MSATRGVFESLGGSPLAVGALLVLGYLCYSYRQRASFQRGRGSGRRSHIHFKSMPPRDVEIDSDMQDSFSDPNEFSQPKGSSSYTSLTSPYLQNSTFGLQEEEGLTFGLHPRVDDEHEVVFRTSVSPRGHIEMRPREATHHADDVKASRCSEKEKLLHRTTSPSETCRSGDCGVERAQPASSTHRVPRLPKPEGHPLPSDHGSTSHVVVFGARSSQRAGEHTTDQRNDENRRRADHRRSSPPELEKACSASVAQDAGAAKSPREASHQVQSNDARALGSPSSQAGAEWATSAELD